MLLASGSVCVHPRSDAPGLIAGQPVNAWFGFLVSPGGPGTGFSPDIVQEASGISALGFVAAGLGVTIVAASYQALSMEGVRFVPVAGHDLTLQVAEP